jgi:hypothetical protein
MINLVRRENLPVPAIASAEAADGAAGLPEDSLFFGGFARFRAKIVP